MNLENHSETDGKEDGNEKYGVQDVKIENHHYVVSIIWKDGKKSMSHFPESGFAVFNPRTKQRLGYISAEEAISILKEHSSEYNMEDFSWRHFVLPPQ